MCSFQSSDLTLSSVYFSDIVCVNFKQKYIEALIVARKTAKAEKNWAESDRIRDELLEQGVVLEDSAAGTSWRRG